MELFKTILLILNAFIFFVISGFHFYWAFGGIYGSKAVLPEFENTGTKVFVPGKFATFVVACLFLSVGVGYVLVWINQLDFSHDTLFYFLIVITAITFIRTIGDFNYVGFFKKKSISIFAVNDTKYYSPLSLWVSLSTLFLILM